MKKGFNSLLDRLYICSLKDFNVYLYAMNTLSVFLFFMASLFSMISFVELSFGYIYTLIDDFTKYIVIEYSLIFVSLLIYYSLNLYMKNEEDEIIHTKRILLYGLYSLFSFFCFSLFISSALHLHASNFGLNSINKISLYNLDFDRELSSRGDNWGLFIYKLSHIILLFMDLSLMLVSSCLTYYINTEQILKKRRKRF